MDTIKLDAVVENVVTATDFVDARLEEAGCPLKAQMQLDIVIDEIFSNIVHYAYHPATGPVTVMADVEENPLCVVITFADHGVPYDPLAEEDSWEPADLPDQPIVTATPAPTVRSEYAGATPVVIDPIDKPTPTAVPKLAVSYVGYDAKTLGLSFEGPAGWTMVDDAEGAFILQNPNARMDYAATLTLRAEKVAADYDTSSLKSVVNGMLDSIGASVEWDNYEPSQTAGRTLLGKDGVYANYSGTLATGEQVAGRVHAVCVGKKLYTIHLTAPQSQWNDYKDMVYDKVRDTLTIVK